MDTQYCQIQISRLEVISFKTYSAVTCTHKNTHMHIHMQNQATAPHNHQIGSQN